MSDANSKIDIYTDGGYRPINGRSSAGAGVWVEGSSYGYSIPCGAEIGDFKTSNNVGELIGIREAFKIAIEKNKETPLKEVVIRSDSKYGLNAIFDWSEKWKKTNWYKTDGNLIKNFSIVVETYNLLNELRKTTKVTDRWVKGHSDNYGNDIADKLATHALRIADTLDETAIQERIKVELTPEFLGDVSGNPNRVDEVKTKVVVAPINPFIAFQHILGLSRKSNVLEDGRTFYLNTTFPKKTKGDMDLGADARMSKVKTDYANTCLCGVVDPDTVESIVITKKPCAILDKIIKKQDEISMPKISFPYLLKWHAIRTGTKWKTLCEEIDLLKPDRHNVHSKGGDQLSYYLSTPAISMQCWERGEYMLYLLKEFEAGNLDSLDITDYFFEGPKAKRKFRQEVADEPIFSVPAHDSIYYFTPNKDCPDKNTLVRITKQFPDARIYLVRSTITKGSLRYHMVIQSKNNIGIYGSPAGNIKLY
jgi:ribonuclease HI